MANRIMTETERVARAICWAFSEETEDCSSVCLNARRCMAETVDPSFMRDAKAACRAIHFPNADWDALRQLAAQGMETAKPLRHEVGSARKGDSPVAESDAPNPEEHQ